MRAALADALKKPLGPLLDGLAAAELDQLLFNLVEQRRIDCAMPHHDKTEIGQGPLRAFFRYGFAQDASSLIDLAAPMPAPLLPCLSAILPEESKTFGSRISPVWGLCSPRG